MYIVKPTVYREMFSIKVAHLHAMSRNS